MAKIKVAVIFGGKSNEHDVSVVSAAHFIKSISENSDRYSIVLPCLPYVDNLIINETEAGKLVGMEPTKENLEEIARKLKAYGVKERVIIHMPELGICVSESGVEIVYSYALPKGFIQGTTGAGDAFCAGALYGIHEGKSDREILEFSSAAAVAALSKPDATSGLKSEKEILAAVQGFARQG